MNECHRITGEEKPRLRLDYLTFNIPPTTPVSLVHCATDKMWRVVSDQLSTTLTKKRSMATSLGNRYRRYSPPKLQCTASVSFRLGTKSAELWPSFLTVNVSTHRPEMQVKSTLRVGFYSKVPTPDRYGQIRCQQTNPREPFVSLES
jgi:hypothetical protein